MPSSLGITPRKKLGYMETRELASLPGRIESLEARQQELFQIMSDPDFYRQPGESITAVKQELAQLEQELEVAFDPLGRPGVIGSGEMIVDRRTGRAAFPYSWETREDTPGRRFGNTAHHGDRYPFFFKKLFVFRGYGKEQFEILTARQCKIKHVASGLASGIAHRRMNGDVHDINLGTGAALIADMVHLGSQAIADVDHGPGNGGNHRGDVQPANGRQVLFF
jgi:hypothetical protein